MRRLINANERMPNFIDNLMQIIFIKIKKKKNHWKYLQKYTIEADKRIFLYIHTIRHYRPRQSRYNFLNS